MKYAKLVKLGGELIDAKDADYQDYYGILTCPECGEPVFLRKGHQRGETVFRAAFVHHRAIPEVSACEMRVGKYSQEYVARVAGEARNQRLRMLEISMWKYLKTTKGLTNVDKWVEVDKRVRASKHDSYLGKFVYALCERPERGDSFLRAFDHQANEIYALEDKELSTCAEFVKSKRRDWILHCKIAREALDVFLSSYLLSEVRARFFRILCFCQTRTSFEPEFSKLPDFDKLRSKDMSWIEKFISYVALYTSMAFLTIDWIEVLNVNKEDVGKTHGLAPLATKSRGE